MYTLVRHNVGFDAINPQVRSQTTPAQQTKTMEFTPINMGNSQPQVQTLMGGTPPNVPPQDFVQYQTQSAQPSPAPFLNVQWRPKEPATFLGKLSDNVVQWFRIVKGNMEFMGGTVTM